MKTQSAMVASSMILFLAALSISARKASAEPYVCPDLAVGETQDDCPWAAVARELTADAEQKKPVMPRLKSLLPELYSQLQQDSARTALKGFWGQSINYDEFAKAIIIHPAIIEALSGFFGVPEPENNVVHAGLEHTYGYLFSVLKTSFGYKRDRWVSGKVEKGLGIAAGTFSPRPEEGTLFSNVTYFAGKVAFRDDRSQLAALEKTEGVAAPLKQFKYSDLKITRLIETVKMPDDRKRVVTIRTDLVAFPNATDKNAYLLVYSIIDLAKDPLPRLITAFPVEASFATVVTDPKNLGDGKPVITRYNAFVRGLSGKTLTGKREVDPKPARSGASGQ